jgi:hypothetical protein
MKGAFLLLIAFALMNNVSAQSKFENGYLITNEGDSINGLILHRNDISLSEKCVFKKDINVEEYIYSPFDINSFRFLNGKYFISKKITRDDTEQNYFLEFLVQGEINLYTLKDHLGISYFFEKPGEKLIEVRQEIITKYIGQNKITEVSKEYINTLHYYFSDVPIIHNSVSNVKLNRKSLIELSKEYHNAKCTTDESCIVYQKKLPRTKVAVTAILGYGTYQIEPKPTDFLSTPHAEIIRYYNEFDICKGFVYGIGSEFTLPYSKERMLIVYEAVVTNYQISSSWERATSSGDFSLKATDLSHNFIFRYNILNTKVKPAFYGGGFISHHLKVQKNGLLEENYIGEIYPEHLYFGLVVGMGFSIELFDQKDYTLKFLYRKGYDNFGYFKSDSYTISFSIPFLSSEI